MVIKVISKKKKLGTCVVNGSVCCYWFRYKQQLVQCNKQPEISTELYDNYIKIKFKSKDILFYIFSLLWLQRVDFIFNQVGDCYIFSYIVG